MNSLKVIISTIALIVGIGGTLLLPQPATAINVFNACDEANKETAVCKSRGDTGVQGVMKVVINTLLYAIGIIAVIMIIIGGLKYTVSGGDQAGINSAKNTILYAVIGLVVAILAFAIVNFVLGRLQ